MKSNLFFVMVVSFFFSRGLHALVDEGNSTHDFIKPEPESRVSSVHVDRNQFKSSSIVEHKGDGVQFFSLSKPVNLIDVNKGSSSSVAGLSSSDIVPVDQSKGNDAQQVLDTISGGNLAESGVVGVSVSQVAKNSLYQKGIQSIAIEIMGLERDIPKKGPLSEKVTGAFLEDLIEYQKKVDVLLESLTQTVSDVDKNEESIKQLNALKVRLQKAKEKIDILNQATTIDQIKIDQPEKKSITKTNPSSKINPFTTSVDLDAVAKSSVLDNMRSIDTRIKSLTEQVQNIENISFDDGNLTYDQCLNLAERFGLIPAREFGGDTIRTFSEQINSDKAFFALNEGSALQLSMENQVQEIQKNQTQLFNLEQKIEAKKSLFKERFGNTKEEILKSLKEIKLQQFFKKQDGLVATLNTKIANKKYKITADDIKQIGDIFIKELPFDNLRAIGLLQKMISEKRLSFFQARSVKKMIADAMAVVAFKKEVSKIPVDQKGQKAKLKDQIIKKLNQSISSATVTNSGFKKERIAFEKALIQTINQNVKEEE